MSIYLARIDFNKLRGVFPGNPNPHGLNLKDPNLTVGGIVSALLPYLFTIAGLILLIYLILGGIGLMTSGGDPKAVDSAKGKITNGLVGFLVIFVAYWLIKILQTILGLPVIF